MTASGTGTACGHLWTLVAVSQHEADGRPTDHELWSPFDSSCGDVLGVGGEAGVVGNVGIYKVVSVTFLYEFGRQRRWVGDGYSSELFSAKKRIGEVDLVASRRDDVSRDRIHWRLRLPQHPLFLCSQLLIHQASTSQTHRLNNRKI